MKSSIKHKRKQTLTKTQVISLTVDPSHNLQTAYSFLSGTLLPLLDLQEDSREVSVVFHLLAQRARRESPSILDELATSLHVDLPQVAALLNSYAVEADASKEGTSRNTLLSQRECLGPRDPGCVSLQVWEY